MKSFIAVTLLAIVLAVVAVSAVSDKHSSAKVLAQLSSNTSSQTDVGTTPCPHRESHPFKCAGAIAKCAIECFVGEKEQQKNNNNDKSSFDPEACVKCIIDDVGSGDAKMCCETLSYHFHFDCRTCRFVP